MKLLTSVENKSSQPFTTTNSNSLNGIEIIDGGSITIPIDISTLETIISITKNGINSKNPNKNALHISLVTNAGITTCIGISIRFLGRFISAKFKNILSGSTFVCFSINFLRGTSAFFIACS